MGTEALKVAQGLRPCARNKTCICLLGWASHRWPSAATIALMRRSQSCLAPSPPAARLVLVAPDEWSRGLVRVKDLAKREESDVPVEELA